MPIKEFSQTEELVTQRRRFEKKLLLLVWVGITTLSVSQMEPFFLAAGTIAIGVCFLAVSGGREVYLPQGSINIAILFSTLILLIDLFLAETQPLAALSHYLILIQLSKLFEKKTNRDYVLLLIMNILLVITAALEVNTLWFGLAMIIYLIILCNTVMVFTVKLGLDAAADACLNSDIHNMGPQEVAWNVTRQWPTKALRWALLPILVIMVTLSTILFFAAPRGEGDRLSLFGKSTGFSSILHLGDLNEIYLSDRIVMKLKTFPDAKGNSTDPSGTYLRGQTYYRYSKSRWSPVGRQFGKKPVETPPADLLKKAEVQEVFMVPDFLPTLFADVNSRYVESEFGPTTQSGGTWSMTARGWLDQPIRYKTHSLHIMPTKRTSEAKMALFNAQRPPENAWLDRDDEMNVVIPDEVSKLAVEWCRDIEEKRLKAISQGKEFRNYDHQIVLRLMKKLKTEKKYEYTLSDLPQAKGERTNLEVFLLDDKKGHCEFFATALTLMCRKMEVKARLATGFFITKAEKMGDAYLVRERDAHAWTEVWSDTMGWQIYDATPFGVSDERQRRTGFEEWRKYWRSTKFYWYEKMSAFDTQIRTAIADWFSWISQGIKLVVVDAFNGTMSGVGWLFSLGHISLILVPLAAIICIILPAYALLRLITRILKRRAAIKKAIEAERALHWKQVAFARKLFDMFQKYGESCWPEQSLRDWSGEMADELDLPSAKVHSLVNLYYALRWGKIDTSKAQIEQAELQAEELCALARERIITVQPVS